MGAPPLLAGWYGKLPALGDFASRRLPATFIGTWDAWLQRGLAASRAGLAGRWLDVYLNGPLWNFALLPGVCGEHAWLGAMMPSVDKVGRHFPLTLAVELPPSAAVLQTVLAAPGWFQALDDAALGCLDIHCAPELLEARLAALPMSPVTPDAAGGALAAWLEAAPAAGLALRLPAGAAAADAVRTAALASLERTHAGGSFWWTAAHGPDGDNDDHQDGALRLLAFHGLPTGREFTLLLDPDAAGA